jgi:hypothetical protein
MMTMDAVLKNPTDAFNYIYGGKGKATLVSAKTGTRYTYKFSRGKRRDGDRGEPLIFVKLLTGPDNQSSYTYIGYINPAQIGLHAGRKGQPTAVAFRALDWAINQLAADVMPDSLEVWHSGTCGRCGRELTVPESIASGLGPVCAGKAQKQ